MSDADCVKWGSQRCCEEPGCGAVLSRYNDMEFCALHAPMVVPRMRGKILD